jgi:uncharacterized protein YjbJ (UPF0337 family)
MRIAPMSSTKEDVMGIMQKAKDKAQQVVGGAKEKAGTATDDPKLHAQGTAQKVSGKAKEVGREIKRDIQQGGSK